MSCIGGVKNLRDWMQHANAGLHVCCELCLTGQEERGWLGREFRVPFEKYYSTCGTGQVRESKGWVVLSPNFCGGLSRIFFSLLGDACIP